MKKLMFLLAALLIAAGSSAQAPAVQTPTAQTPEETSRQIVEKVYKELPVMSEALDYIVKNYVDEDKLKGDQIFHGAIKGMVGTLDQHTHFMEKEAFQELQSETGGVFSGVGLELTVRNDILTVVAPIEKGPAWQQGVKAGDRILKIDGVITKSLTVDAAVKKIRGPKGEKVILAILHEGEDKPVDVEIIRDNIKIQSVQSYVIKENYGYIRLRNFIESSGRDIGAALAVMEKAKVKGVIIDLRNNPGGLLDVSVDIADKFLPPDKMIVYTQGRISSSNRKYYSSQSEQFGETVPLIVFVNRGSASASEIVTGSLKDNKRAVVMGTQSFGKASVQSIFRLSDGSGLRLTTAYYYTPSGVKIHEKGITPDVIVEEKAPGDITWKLRYYEYFITYAKKYLGENKTITAETVKVDDKMFDDFLKDVRAKSFVITDLDIEKNRDFIKSFMKADIIKALNGEDSGERILVEEDELVKRAMDIFRAAELMNGGKAVAK